MPQARAIATRARIVAAAGALFAEQGYEMTSTADIVKQASVTKGALYFHFPTKAAIAEAVMEQQTEALDLPAPESKLQAVIDITTSYARRLQTDVMLRGAVRLSVDAATTSTPDTRAFTEPIELLEKLLTEARADGELRDCIDPREFAELITGGFTGIQLLSQAMSGRVDLLERVTVLWNTLLPAVATDRVRPKLRIT